MPLPPPPGFDPIYNSSDDSDNENIVKPEPEELIPPPDVPGSGSNGSGPAGSDGDDASKKRPAAGGEASAAKRPKMFDRFFTQADDIALLNGMIQFAELKRSSPLDDLKSFLEFARPSLECKPSMYQLKTKVAKFKSKCIWNLVKEKLGGEEARRLRAHEQKAFDLSKLVWANRYIWNKKFEDRLDAAMKKGIPKKKKKNNNKTKNDEVEEEKKKEEKKRMIALLKVTNKKRCLLCTITNLVIDALENE